MPPLDPQTVFRVLWEQYDVVEEVYQSTRGMRESDVRSTIDQQASGPHNEYVLQQLQELGIIQEKPGATATFELGHEVRHFLSFLKREQQLNSPDFVKGLIEAIQRYSDDLRESLDRSKPEYTIRALDKLNLEISRLQRISEDNRIAVINAVMSLRKKREQLSVHDRFSIINQIWTNHLTPLREMIRVNRITDRALDGLARRLDRAYEVYRDDDALNQEAASTRARLVALQSQLHRDFRESWREVDPMYQQLRRDSRLARGAATLLEGVQRSGIAALDLETRLPISHLRIENLFANEGVEAFVAALRDDDPAPPAPLGLTTSERHVAPLLTDRALKTLRSHLPVDDLLGWLVATYPEHHTDDLLSVYTHVLHDGDLHIRVNGGRRTYRHGTLRLDARPLAVLVPTG